MRLCSPKEVAIQAGDTAFYPAAWRGLFAAALIFAAIAGYAAIPKGAGNLGLPAWIPAAMALYLLVLAALQRWRLRGGSGWRMVLSRQGVYIQLRHRRGRHRNGGATVVFLEPAEISHVRLVVEELRLPHRFGMTRHHIAHIDVALNKPMYAEIRQACLSGQQEYRNSGNSGAHPVFLPMEDRVRICWDGMHPGEREALALASGQFRVLPALRVIYPLWEDLEQELQLPYVRMINEMGWAAEAEFILRIHRGMSRSVARALLEGRAGLEEG